MILHASAAISFHLLSIFTAAGDHTDALQNGPWLGEGQAITLTMNSTQNLEQLMLSEHLWLNVYLNLRWFWTVGLFSQFMVVSFCEVLS